MPTVKSGHVVVSKTISPREFESKKIQIQLDFELMEGETLDQAIEYLMAQAKKHIAMQLKGEKRHDIEA
jgi:hypothetical protein